METDTKVRALGLFLSILDGRDPGLHVREITGEECVSIHNALKAMDDLLKQRWRVMGEPDFEEVL